MVLGIISVIFHYSQYVLICMYSIVYSNHRSEIMNAAADIMNESKEMTRATTE